MFKLRHHNCYFRLVALVCPKLCTRVTSVESRFYRLSSLFAIFYNLRTSLDIGLMSRVAYRILRSQRRDAERKSYGSGWKVDEAREFLQPILARAFCHFFFLLDGTRVETREKFLCTPLIYPRQLCTHTCDHSIQCYSDSPPRNSSFTPLSYIY